MEEKEKMENIESVMNIMEELEMRNLVNVLVEIFLKPTPDQLHTSRQVEIRFLGRDLIGLQF